MSDTLTGQSPYQWLERHAEHSPTSTAVVTWRDGGPTERLDWATLLQRAGQACTGLTDNGVAQGDRVIIAVPNEAAFVILLVACGGVGAIAVPAPPPAGRRAEANRGRLLGMIRACRPAVIVTADADVAEVARLVSELDDRCRVIGTTEVIADHCAAAVAPRRTYRPDAVALLQFTSGSTGNPRGVVIREDALRAQCGQAAAAYQESPADVAVSWVPLYHDMGLVTAVLRPLYSGYRTVLLRPEDFVREPMSWLTAIDECGGTLASSPNFGYELCVRKVPSELVERLDLQRWRVARNAGEVVRPSTEDRFTEHFAPAGFARTAFCPSYGLAEATLTVTTATPTVRPRRIAVRRDALDGGQVVRAEHASQSAGTVSLLASGTPLPGTEVRISGQETPGHIGQVLVRGPQMSPGYWESDSTVRPNRVAADDWYATGDLGFLWDDQLFVLGRVDDTLVLNGRNYFAEDIAAACLVVPEVRGGRVAAFVEEAAGDTGEVPKVRLIAEVAAEVDASPPRLARLSLAVKRAVARSLDLYLTDVEFVRHGALPVTTSGKVRRSEVRRRYSSGRLALLPTQPR
ncbi:AMP-binding protein [Micromonospora sp. C51]|uniref:AMP-binding protein n=1 Tax=Micromonospora sp. C51 TaxID=2824879 RepID=UPI001B38C768|nr:AMP-binding protein [Micromonospora sp. C51]MBQ1050173.1 AMP-binding protein [Micromonospora sp. C51]